MYTVDCQVQKHTATCHCVSSSTPTHNHGFFLLAWASRGRACVQSPRSVGAEPATL